MALGFVNVGGGSGSDLKPEDVGLGNVPNVATNDQTPTYTEATALQKLSSGEKLHIAMGKIAKAVSSLISHVEDKKNPHNVTAKDVGAYTTEQTDNAIKTAIGDAIGGSY